MILQVLNYMPPGNRRKRHLMMVVILTRLALIDRFQQIVRGVMVDGIEAGVDQLLQARALTIGGRVESRSKRAQLGISQGRVPDAGN